MEPLLSQILIRGKNNNNKGSGIILLLFKKTKQYLSCVFIIMFVCSQKMKSCTVRAEERTWRLGNETKRKDLSLC